MKVVIHQPHYFPYPGFFHKLTVADIFVVMDNTQYDKRFTNRNKILAESNSTKWITVPINKKHKFVANRLVEINNNVPWRTHNFDSIRGSYTHSKFFHLYENYFKNLYEKEWKYLCDLDIETLKKTIEWLGIKIKIVLESELKINGKGTEHLINVCKVVDADTYISGIGGKNYMNEKLFEQNNIKLVYQNYEPVVYEQHLSKSFIPNLSIIDLLCNVGNNSLNLITKNNKINTKLIST